MNDDKILMWIVIAWAIGGLASLGIAGVIIWAIVKLVMRRG